MTDEQLRLAELAFGFSMTASEREQLRRLVAYFVVRRARGRVITKPVTPENMIEKQPAK